MHQFQQKKVLIFGLFGVLGCLLGWAVGELVVIAAHPSKDDESPPAESLIFSGKIGQSPEPPAPVFEKRKPPPSSSPEFAVLRKKREGELGKLTLTIKWFNKNDLDLHCIDPNGDWIYWHHRNAETKGSDGKLDVDSNGEYEGHKVQLTDEPIENIFYKKADSTSEIEDPPLGEYRVFVQYYLKRGEDKTPYQYEILMEDQPAAIKEIGSIAFERSAEQIRMDEELEKSYIRFYKNAFPERAKALDLTNLNFGKQKPIQEIRRFNLAGLRIAVPPKIEIYPGKETKLLVRFERDRRNNSPISLSFLGNTAGLKLGTTNVSGDRSVAEIPLSADASALIGERLLTVVATGEYGKVEAIFKVDVQAPRPALEIAASKELSLRAGKPNRIKVEIKRENFSGPVTVRATSGLTGLRVAELQIPEGQHEANMTISSEAGADVGNRSVTIAASGAGVNDETHVDVDVKSSAPSWSWLNVLVLAAWTALLAIGLSLALVVGQNRYLSRPLLSAREATILCIGGGLAGLVAGALGQALFGLLASVGGPSEIGRLIGWPLLGGLLGRGVGFFIPNLDARRSSVAGITGGFLGGLAFILISGDVRARLVGACVLGFCIGIMVALVEQAFRTACLEVRFGLAEAITVNLGSDLVTVGGDGTCTIWARGSAPIAYRFWMRDGKILTEDVVAGHTEEVADGAYRKAADVELIVHADPGQARTRNSSEGAVNEQAPMSEPATALENSRQILSSAPLAPLDSPRKPMESKAAIASEITATDVTKCPKCKSRRNVEATSCSICGEVF